MASWLASWASVYSNSATLRTLLGFAHVGGLVVSAGAAFTIDRAILRAARVGSIARGSHLADLEASHPIVIGGLAVVLLSGILLFAADVDTYLHSAVFWIKMGLIVFLLLNGWTLRRLGHRAAHDSGASPAALGRAAAFSIALWTLTTLAGAALPNA
jgi:uncharacterized membrane protein